MEVRHQQFPAGLYSCADMGWATEHSVDSVDDVAADAAGRTTLRIIPFSPGRRPTDEAAHPGLGSSDGAAIRTGCDPDANRATVLFDVVGSRSALEVDVTVCLLEPGSTRREVALAGWSNRRLDLDDDESRTTQQFHLYPERDITPSACDFVHGFLRQASVSIRATRAGDTVAQDETLLDVCDVERLGSLYTRVIERIVAPDTARQARNARVADPGVEFHPWYPVLTIGGDKAALYTSALVADIVGKERHLTDPAWLLRVGVYLELLTCIGIFEAVRGDLGDVLSADERRAFEHGDAYREIRNRVDVDAWKRIWDTRKIAFPRHGVPRAGPVSALNLIQKKRATLAFLHVHHDDLKHAIELAGANHHNSQETWQRVFRDAERAVLRKTDEAFPELRFLPSSMRDLVLWQQHGIAGQQGLYPTACTQYRSSMNSVANWAKARGLMDHTGDECVPLRASLLDARMRNPSRVAILQRGDGSDDDIDLVGPPSGGDRAPEHEPSTADFESLLADVPILQMLSVEDLRALALVARPLLAMPDERIVVQGSSGDSLFVVADGDVEVMLRREGGIDTSVDRMGRGAVFGEMALLTGERRTATVRAVDTALVFEIGKQQYEPLLQRHPEWLDELSEMMEDRLYRRGLRLSQHDRDGLSIRDRIRQRFLSQAR
jgi:CRP-like cAMP-binding protein